MAAETLHQNRVTMVECVPSDLGFLTTYQRAAFDQILWDENGETIKGLQPRQYMLRGLHEEIGEITGPDRIEPDYRRVGALLMMEGYPTLQAGQETPSSVKRHLKEFGDASWYVANFLSLFDLPVEKAVSAGLLAWKLDNVAAPRASEEFCLNTEARFPWILLSSHSKGLLDASDAIMSKPHDERIPQEKALVIASGKFILSMMHMAVARFGTSYGAILNTNQDKIAKRIADGTVFDKSGGDDR